MAGRLRKTFQYPDETQSNSDSRNIDDELDSEQQETIIAQLKAQDEKSLAVWITFFTALPLIAATAYLSPLVQGPSRRELLMTVVSLTSLFSTAYTVYAIPYRPSSPAGLVSRRSRAHTLDLESPIRSYLPILNAVLSSVLALLVIPLWRRGDVVGAVWTLIPGVIYAVAMLARRDLVALDVEGLEKLKYDYKGA